MNSRSALALAALGAMAGWASGCSAGHAPHRAGSASSHAAASHHAAAESTATGHHRAGAEAAGDAYGAEAEAAPERPGLGTRFGESVHSRVVEAPFVRAGAEPFAAVALHYNDEEGVAAQAEHRGAQLIPITASTPHGGISIALTDEHGAILPGFSAAGRTYVIGSAGERYNLRISNHTEGRYEVVASVDGLDVIDGRPAGYGKRGYIVAPHRTIVIDGFRTSEETVAAFRFASVRDSYAARTGDDRNVGVIGLAFFAERGSAWTSDELARRESADPFPARYALPPP